MLEQTVAKNIRLSKSLLGFYLKCLQSYIIAGNTADTWRKTSLEKLKTNQKIKKYIKIINHKPNRKNTNQIIAK